MVSVRRNTGPYHRRTWWKRPDLLILDDFGMREYSVLQAEDLYELVSWRYRRGAMILTTNREPKDLYPLFPNPVLAEGLLDRLLNSAYVVPMLGRSYRSQQRPDQTPPTTERDSGGSAGK